MSYRREGSIRDAYEEHFPNREVIYKRVVSVVEKRSLLRPEQDYAQEYDYEDQRYSGSRSYHDQDDREHRGKNTHGVVDRGGYYGETTRFSSGSRKSSPPRKDSYPYYRGSRDNTPTGRQVKLSGERAGSLPSSRGRGPGPPRSLSAGKADRRGEKPIHELTYTGEDHEDVRQREPYPGWDRSRSPLTREAQACSYQQSQRRRNKKAYKKAHSQNGELDKVLNPNSYLDALDVVGVKEDPPADPPQPPASVSKPAPGARVSVKSKSAPDEDFATRRSREIADKALEIEKLYRQDCMTFGTVVNMLVTKEPRLDQLLQAPLHKSLVEIKERCLEDLRHFIEELDQVASKLGTPSQ